MIIVRRMLTEPKTVLAGVTLDSSFARFSPSMATSSEERTLSRPFGRLDLSAMVERQGSNKKAVGRGGCEKKNRNQIEMGVHLVIARLKQTDPFDEVNY